MFTKDKYDSCTNNIYIYSYFYIYIDIKYFKIVATNTIQFLLFNILLEEINLLF
jgi:hypothetical protein